MDHEITRLLDRMRDGDAAPSERLYGLVYPELRRLAHRQLGRLRPGQTLATTALVSEAWLKLTDHAPRSSADRRHFLATAALAMRQILVDYARQRQAKKRGDGERPLRLEEDFGDGVSVEIAAGEAQAADLLALDRALERLAEADPRLARIVELRFFGGLSVDEVAAEIGVSTPTVKRDTRLARAFLKRELGGGGSNFFGSSRSSPG